MDRSFLVTFGIFFFSFFLNVQVKTSERNRKLPALVNNLVLRTWASLKVAAVILGFL